MKIKVRFALLMAAFAIAAFCAAAPVLASRPEEEKTQQVLEGTAEEYSSSERSKYILREHNNCISVFCGDERVKDTRIDVSQLRAHDREILSDGIAVDTYGEVLSLIEDFES